MSTSAIGTTNSTTNSATDSVAAAQNSLSGNFDTFLTLLTTQLKNQDPLKPMDSTEFTNQLVQFSEVEQQINSNKQLTQLVNMQSTNQTIAALNYIGDTVEATGTSLPLVNGKAQMTYTLPENANKATLVISDQNGKLVRAIDVDTSSGKHTVSWDGTTSDGTQLPDGTYTIQVSASSADNQSLDVPTGIVGTVTGAQHDSNGTYLTVGPVQVGIDKIVSVSKPSTA